MLWNKDGMARPNYIPFRTVEPIKANEFPRPYDYVRPFERYDADSTILAPTWHAIETKKADCIGVYRDSEQAVKLRYPARPISLFCVHTVPSRTIEGHAAELLDTADPNLPRGSAILGDGPSDATSWLISVTPKYWAWMFAEYETYRRFMLELTSGRSRV